VENVPNPIGWLTQVPKPLGDRILGPYDKDKVQVLVLQMIEDEEDSFLWASPSPDQAEQSSEILTGGYFIVGLQYFGRSRWAEHVVWQPTADVSIYKKPTLIPMVTIDMVVAQSEPTLSKPSSNLSHRRQAILNYWERSVEPMLVATWEAMQVTVLRLKYAKEPRVLQSLDL